MMGYVPSVEIAFVMIFISMVAWGSWANAMKKCGNWRFEAFYWDYAWSIILGTLLLAFSLGGVSSTGWSPDNFIKSLETVEYSAFGWAMFSGFVWGLGNILLVTAIVLAGFSIAFPLGVGLATVLGSILAFLVNPSATSQPTFLFIGLILVILALVADGLAYKTKEVNGEKGKHFKRGVMITILCGVLIGLFPFPFNYVFQSGLNGYGASLFMTIGAFIATLAILPILMQKSLIPNQSSIGFAEYKRARISWHVWAIAAGLVWSLGTTFNLVAASQPAFSVAIAYTLGQSAIMVAALWGIFVWKEFRGASRQSHVYLGAMFSAFIIGILFLAKATG